MYIDKQEPYKTKTNHAQDQITKKKKKKKKKKKNLYSELHKYSMTLIMLIFAQNTYKCT